MKFVIFHGAFGSPEDNWLPQLKEKLEALGQQVLVPKFPVDNWETVTKAGPNKPSKNQNLANWMKVFDEVCKSFKKGEKLCFVAHSLSPLFVLHLVDKYGLQLDSAIFVAPFLESLSGSWQIDHVNKSFYKTDFDFKKLRKFIPLSYTLYSDNDPYVDKKFSIDFANKMESSLIFVKRAGHMNLEVNLNEFPLVFELCKTRLDLSLYQKYLAHRRELYSVDYIKDKSEEIIFLDPEHVLDEGVFHFRNLRIEGFCTLYTALKFWDVQSTYMTEARKAARRIKNLTRVFIIDKLSDLKRKKLLRQIKLDFKSAIKVYFCFYDDIKKLVGEPDFGIWDNDYVCIVSLDKTKRIKEVKLSSRKSDLLEARRWQKVILRKATRIYNLDKDVSNFISQRSK